MENGFVVMNFRRGFQPDKPKLIEHRQLAASHYFNKFLKDITAS